MTPMPTVYRKTAKGQDEIAHRTHRLQPRLRQALILVDGKRSDEDFVQMLPQAGELLRALIDGGFVEAAAVVAAAPVRVDAPAPAAPAAAPPPPPAPPFGDALKREIVRNLNDQLGPMAETLAMKVERVRSAEELRPVLEQAQRALRDMRGAAAARAFAERYLGA
jgi:hypothetical protein